MHLLIVCRNTLQDGTEARLDLASGCSQPQYADRGQQTTCLGGVIAASSTFCSHLLYRAVSCQDELINRAGGRP